jgi:hypothetical protein
VLRFIALYRSQKVREDYLGRGAGNAPFFSIKWTRSISGDIDIAR